MRTVADVEWYFERQEIYAEQSQAKMSYLKEVYENAFEYAYSDDMSDGAISVSLAYKVFKDYLSNYMDSDDVRLCCDWLSDDERFNYEG